MSPISQTELNDLAKRLPHARENRGDICHMMRPSHVGMRYPGRYEDPGSYSHSFEDRLTFRATRGHLDGTYVWYWSYNGVIVRVDV